MCKRFCIIAIFLIMPLLCWSETLSAGNPLGIGANEVSTLPTESLFRDIALWINASRESFYHSLVNSLKAMRENNASIFFLVMVSFAYGIFHAAGPGHGKIIISSYMLANEIALRRSILIAFASATLQAISAIFITGSAFLLLHKTSLSMTETAHFLEISSYLMLCGFGAWLTGKKLRQIVRLLQNKGKDTENLEEISCCSSSSHAISPHTPGEKFHYKSALPAIIAAGIRPCSGGLIILSFAFLNGLWIGGIASVFAMAFGVFLTVSSVALLTVTGKNWIHKKFSQTSFRNIIHTGLEMTGAFLLFLLGFIMLLSELSKLAIQGS